MAGSVLSILTMLLTVPLLLALVGIERYGAYSVAIAFLGYFGLFDLGVSRAVARKVATVRHIDPTAVPAVLSTGLAVTLGFSAIGAALVALGANLFFAEGMRLSDELRAEAIGSGWLLGALLPMTLLTGLFAGVLQGFERFLRLNLVNVGGVVTAQVFPLLAAWLAAPTLEWLLAGLLAARFLALVAMIAAVTTSATGAARWVWPRKWLALDLLVFGGWVSVSAVIGPVLTTIDRMAIGATLGGAAVAIYTIPFGLVRRVELLPMALASAIFPRLAGEADPEARRKLSARAVGALSATVTPMIVCGGLLIAPFLTFWIDADFAREAAPVGTILLAAFWARAQALAPFELLTAAGRPDLIAKLHLVEVGPYLAALALGLHLFGIEGAAAAWALRALADLALLHLLAARHAPIGARPRVAAPAVFIASTIAVSLSLPVDSALRWILSAAIVAFSIAWGWRAAPEELRRRLIPW